MKKQIVVCNNCGSTIKYPNEGFLLGTDVSPELGHLCLSCGRELLVWCSTLNLKHKVDFPYDDNSFRFVWGMIKLDKCILDNFEHEDVL